MPKKVFSILLLVLIVSTEPMAHAQPAPSIQAFQPSAASDPRSKIQPSLLNDIEQQLGNGMRLNQATPASIEFVARVAQGTDLAPYTTQWFARRFVDPAGITVAVGAASANELLKIASLPEVASLQRPESLIDAPPPVTGKPVDDGITPNGWYDTGTAIHGSQAAWAKGYTGKGVRILINDSGADYCNADLLGTWAYIDNPASPYYGLPEMFDSWSSYLSARDYYVKDAFVRDGRTDYSDTSAVVSGPVGVYQTIGANAPHTYVLPNTSLSGIYHIGSHPDKALAASANAISMQFGASSAVDGERAAVLVADSTTSGVYDTVYVDLNYNYDFSDDTPARLDRTFGGREAACRDTNNDGLNDLSGGLVYFIADGRTAIPTQDWYWGVPGSAYANGSLVAFHIADYTEKGGDHGTRATSAAVGQGRIRGSVIAGPSGPPQAGGQGLVLGAGKEARTTQNGNFYLSPFLEDGFLFAALGYDGAANSGDDSQVISNSWSRSATDNDGLDYESRLLDLVARVYGQRTAMLFAAGNSGGGYGTVVPPKPASGISVGASTAYDQVGAFEPIRSASQMIGGDVASWSARGPLASGAGGVDVVAAGTADPASLPLNSVRNGAIATGEFSGTSAATPVAAGNLALLLQAWRTRTGQWPTFDESRALLMGTARNIGHDTLSQGAGMVNASVGVDVAAGVGGTFAQPASWAVGGYRGTAYTSFPRIVTRGASEAQTFTLSNPSNQPLQVRLDSQRFLRIGSKEYDFTTSDQSLDHGLVGVPDYVRRIDQDFSRDTDLFQVQVVQRYEQFDPANNLVEPFNNWQVLFYNWSDLNKNGSFWRDTDRNGKVSAAVDAQGVVSSEMDAGEYVRMNASSNVGPSLQARVAFPYQRQASGLLLGFRHTSKLASVPRTDLNVEVTAWKASTWDWIKLDRSSVTIPARSTATFRATMNVPAFAPYGLYEGSVVATYTLPGGASTTVVMPVTAAVAANGNQFDYANQGPGFAPQLYDNQNMSGYTDYSGDEASGDWRVFWNDIAAKDVPTDGAPYLVVDNRWRSPGTDIDTIILGPSRDCFSNNVNCPGLFSDTSAYNKLYGPYTLSERTRTQNTYIGDGRWRFNTTSGEPRDFVAAPLTEGLHAVLLHQVKVDGRRIDEPIAGRVGVVTVNPGAVVAQGATGSVRVHVTGPLFLTDLQAQGFGLSMPTVTRETVRQDDPFNPSTASFTRQVEIKNGALLDVQTSNSANGADYDLYVYGPNGALVSVSAMAGGNERVSLKFPQDGTYTIAVHGYSVPTGSDTFTLTVNAVQGTDVTATDVTYSVKPGQDGRLTVNWNATGKPAGTYSGLVLLGPSRAPGLFEIPVQITVP